MENDPKEKDAGKLYDWLAPLLLILTFLMVWFFICHWKVVPSYQLPHPCDVMISFKEDALSGRLISDVTASLWRVMVGFGLAAALGIPAGISMGRIPAAKKAVLPLLNFFRFLSPLAWIPFAILWFHIGDKPAIFLIFMSSFFPLALSTMVAVASIPAIYFRVAKDYELKGLMLLKKVTFPAILPQIITGMRVSCGIAWIVIVAAEMVGCQDGLGFGIWDARNGLKLDTAVSYMIVIGMIGMIIDRLLAQLTKLPKLRWGYER